MSKQNTDILSMLREEYGAGDLKPIEMVPCIKCGGAFELVDSVVQWRCPPCQGAIRNTGEDEAEE